MPTHPASLDGVKVTTGECRASYAHLFEPYTQKSLADDKDPKFSVMLLIPKSDKSTLKALKGAQQQALIDGKDRFKGGKVPKDWNDSIHDCDKEDDLEDYPEREGHYRLNVSSNMAYPPGIIDRKMQKILDPTEIYSGCYIRVSLMAFVYNVSGNQGVSFGLRNVQKMGDGEPLGGGSSAAENDFDALPDEENDEDEDWVEGDSIL